MYRLLKFRNVHLNTLQGMPVYASSKNTKINVSNKTCMLCQELNSFNNFKHDFKRYQSTHTSPNVVTKKPRRKPRIKGVKNYAELLVVTDKSTSEQKAKIQHLRPNDLKILALTNFNLNELYKLKDFIKNNHKTNIVSEHTYNNLADINNIPGSIAISVPNVDNNFSIENVLPVINDRLNKVHENLDNLNDSQGKSNIDLDHGLRELMNVKPNSALQPEILEEMIEPQVEETVELEENHETKDESVQPKPVRVYDKKAQEEIINRTLASYMETCCNLKSPQRALNALHFHRHRVSKGPRDKYPPITNVNVYNSLLKGFAAKGDFHKLIEVLKYVDEEKVKLNAQSYSAIFECLARVNYSSSHLKYIRIFTNQARSAGYTFDRILNEAVFLYDQRAKVLETMQMYDSKYIPKYTEPSVLFKNHLLDHLNNPVQLEGLPELGNNKSGIFTKEKLKRSIHKQIEIEKNVFVVVKSIEAKPEPTEEVKKYREALAEHIKMWEETALEAFNRDLAAMAAQRSSLNFEPYMKSIPTKDFIAIIVDEAKKLAQGSETFSLTVNMLYRDLGEKVYSKYKVLKKQKSGVLDKMISIHNKYCENYASSHSDLGEVPTVIDYLNPRQKWQWAEHSFKHEGSTILMDHQPWVPTAIQAIGKFLYHIVMHDLKIDVNVMRNNSKHKNYLPAFYTIFRNQGRLVKEEVKPHPILSKLYRASIPETLSFPAYEVPMKCPPVPWVSVESGGYLVCHCDVVRLPGQATLQRQRLAEADPNTLYPSLDALNQLGAVPWMVNRRILDVILEVFKNGGSSQLDVPEPPSALPPPPTVTADMDKTQKFQNFRQKLQHRRKKAEMFSLWCDCLYRLSLANHFRDDIFWLPHNMDFRGRVYPVPPHLNHLGSDLARSMLVFAEARPLGPEGLNWLKLHLVNLTGLKKRDCIKDRLVFAKEIMDDILDSADRPLTGRKWWAESDEPWQTLACCFEIAAAHRSPDPEKFLSHFTVHQDGSCNGLQHYAALGRDGAGAYSVNLSHAEIPQDVYSAVATLVEEKRLTDAENGLEIAKTLAGFVKRKVIKQTVMTTVYGVTRFGARLQIARQLKDIENFPKDSVWVGSSYLTGRTFDSLRSMFTSTREIQDWFTDCARLISSVCGQNVEWVTPMGLPIVQPYFRYKKISSGGVYESFHMDKYEKPNVMKQKNAFPPNFIHSLDSSHMMLTSLHCERAGITFVSVHDCYWTHPSTVHIMNKICREQFVALHSEPILENLSVFLNNKYSYSEEAFADDGSVSELTKKKLNRVLRKLPKTGRFDIKEVLDSIYFFS